MNINLSVEVMTSLKRDGKIRPRLGEIAFNRYKKATPRADIIDYIVDKESYKSLWKITLEKVVKWDA